MCKCAVKACVARWSHDVACQEHYPSQSKTSETFYQHFSCFQQWVLHLQEGGSTYRNSHVKHARYIKLTKCHLAHLPIISEPLSYQFGNSWRRSTVQNIPYFIKFGVVIRKSSLAYPCICHICDVQTINCCCVMCQQTKNISSESLPPHALWLVTVILQVQQYKMIRLVHNSCSIHYHF